MVEPSHLHPTAMPPLLLAEGSNNGDDNSGNFVDSRRQTVLNISCAVRTCVRHDHNGWTIGVAP